MSDVYDRLAGINAYKNARVVVTTHAMLCNIPEEVLKGYNAVIVDEDILYLQILNNIKKVGRRAIEMLSQDVNSGYRDMALQMLKAEEGKYYKINNFMKFPPKSEKRDIKNDESDGDYYTDDELEEEA